MARLTGRRNHRLPTLRLYQLNEGYADVSRTRRHLTMPTVRRRWHGRGNRHQCQWSAAQQRLAWFCHHQMAAAFTTSTAITSHLSLRDTVGFQNQHGDDYRGQSIHAENANMGLRFAAGQHLRVDFCPGAERQQPGHRGYSVWNNDSHTTRGIWAMRFPNQWSLCRSPSRRAMRS